MSVNTKEDVRAYLETLLGKDVLAKMDKQLEVSTPKISKFTNYKGYSKAMSEATQAIADLTGERVFNCPTSAGSNVKGSNWHDLSNNMQEWGAAFADNSVETIAFILGEGTRRRRDAIHAEVFRDIEKAADALDAQAEATAKHVLHLLRPVLILQAETAYKDDEARMLRHLEKVREDIMDELFLFFAPVQKTLTSVDKGNAAFSAAIKALQGKSYAEIAKSIQSLSIHGSRTAIKLPVESIAIDSFDPHLGFIAQHDSLSFYVQTRTSVDRQDKDGYHNGITDTDVTDKVIRILNVLLK